VEKSIHQSLVKLNAGGGKEWFRMTPQQALDVAVMISNSPSLSKTDVEILQDLLEENLLKQQRIMGRFNSFIEQFNHENKQTKVSDLAAGNAKKIDLKLKRDAAIKAKADESERLYQEAIKVCAELQKASTSLLQRRLSIGYGRAARIMERLELEGYVTGPDGSHARTFLGQPVKEDIINTFS
jgi:DNA segregation ATPase FtsK/SpoIIIE-like protein